MKFQSKIEISWENLQTCAAQGALLHFSLLLPPPSSLRGRGRVSHVTPGRACHMLPRRARVTCYPGAPVSHVTPPRPCHMLPREPDFAMLARAPRRSAPAEARFCNTGLRTAEAGAGDSSDVALIFFFFFFFFCFFFLLHLDT